MKEWVEALKEYKVLLGEPEKEELKRISYDSRKAEAGDLFLCMKGSKLDSHDKIPELLEKGVRLFVVEKELEENKVKEKIQTFSENAEKKIDEVKEKIETELLKESSETENNEQ